MDFTAFLKALDPCWPPDWDRRGFRQVSPGAWRRRTGDELNLIWIQKHSSHETCCVNLGIHYAFLPEAGNDAPLVEAELKLQGCEIRLRLGSDPDAEDQWWPLSEASACQIAPLIATRGEALFESYRLDGPIASLQAADIEHGNVGLLAELTDVRACLLLARIHEHFGQRERCVQAALLGVQRAGRALNPKHALQEILKRCGAEPPPE